MPRSCINICLCCQLLMNIKRFILRIFGCGTFCGNSLEEILQHLWNTSWLKSTYILYQTSISTKTIIKNTYLCFPEPPKSIFSCSLGPGYEIIQMVLLYPEGQNHYWSPTFSRHQCMILLVSDDIYVEKSTRPQGHQSCPLYLFSQWLVY